MAKDKPSKGSLSKVFKLVSVLEKCNGKASLDSSTALISPKAAKGLLGFGLVLLTAGLFVGLYFLAPVIAPYVPLSSLAQSLMLLMMLLCFVLAVKNIVTVLYTADDLPVLLPMPFSAGQIVGAKLAVSSRFPVILSLILINSICLGYGVRVGADAAFVIGTILSSILIPLTSIAFVTLLVVIVFRVFGFIRNRDITMLLGGVFTIALTVAYVFVTNRFNSDGSGREATALLEGLTTVSSGFPNIAFMGKFMFEGDFLSLLLSVGFTLLLIAAAMLAVKFFYLSTALSMQNTSGKSKAVTKEALSGSGKTSALKALTAYESKSTRRNPSYMIYGFGMSFLWPLFVVLPLVLGNDGILTRVVYPLDFKAALTCALLFGVLASSFSCGMNNLAGSAFSREGDTYSALKTMPIRFSDYYKSKRNFALLICSLGSIVYILVLGIFCVAAGVVDPMSCWVFLAAALISYLLNLTFINFMLLQNSRKPYFTWDSETEISRKLTWVNVIFLVIGLVTEIGLMILLAFSPLASTSDGVLSEIGTIITVITACVLGIGVPVLAFIVNRFSVKKAEENLSKLD